MIIREGLQTETEGEEILTFHAVLVEEEGKGFLYRQLVDTEPIVQQL